MPVARSFFTTQPEVFGTTHGEKREKMEEQKNNTDRLDLRI
jgi:hypothetical protein